MTASMLVNGLVKRLGDAGYDPLPTPFKVASVDFEFTAALLGTEGRGLDLLLIVDTATGEYGDRDASKVRQRVEALSRALDITGSRYVLTLILAGATLPGDIEALSATCRVLTIEHAGLDEAGNPTSEDAAEALDDHIRVLLPLDIRSDDVASAVADGDPIEELLLALPNTIDQDLVRALANASISGEEAVTKSLGSRLDQALAVKDEP
jgi:hypothetical protein